MFEVARSHTLSAGSVRVAASLLSVIALVLSLFMVGTPQAHAATRPNSTNTGVPAGTVLKKYVGDMVITTPGKVIDSYDIYGTVTVKAANVTISKSRIRGNQRAVQQDLVRGAGSVANGLKVVDSTIAPTTPTVYHRIGIRFSGSGQTALRVNVSGTVDGIRIAGTSIRVENSWLHDFKHYANDPEHSNGSHDDAIQVEGGKTLRILNNTFTGAYNAGVMVNQNLSAVGDMYINSNYGAGGGCTVNIVKGSRGYMSGLQLNSNRFGRGQRVKNCAAIYTPTDSNLKPTGNVWDDTGSAIPLPKP